MHFLQQSFPQDNWGLLLPDMKGLLRTLPDLYVTERSVVDPLEKVNAPLFLPSNLLLENVPPVLCKDNTLCLPLSCH